MGRCFILQEGYWWELAKILDDDNSILTYRCLNQCGAGYDLLEKDFDEIYQKYKLCIADSWSDLDWSGTAYLDDKYETGWLDPQGNFYGCNYRSHEGQATLVHKSTERELELKGWIKLSYSFGNEDDPLVLADIACRPTKKQLDYIAGTKFAKSTQYIYWMDR